MRYVLIYRKCAQRKKNEKAKFEKNKNQ